MSGHFTALKLREVRNLSAFTRNKNIFSMLLCVIKIYQHFEGLFFVLIPLKNLTIALLC